MAARRRSRAGSGRASDAAGAIRRHGGRVASGAGLAPTAARAGGDGRTAVRRPARERRAGGGKPIPAISPRSTGSAPSGRPSTAARQTARACPGLDPGTAMTRKSDTSLVTQEGETLSEPVRFRRGWMLGDGTGCGKGREVAGSSSTTACADGRRPSGSRSPTSCWRTRAATGRRSAGWKAMSSPWATSARGWRSPSTRASCSRPTPRCARRPARASPRASTRSSNGSRGRSTRRTATPSTVSSCSTRRTPWPTPPARSPSAARPNRPSRVGQVCGCRTHCRTPVSPTCRPPAPPPCRDWPMPAGSDCGAPARRRSRSASSSSPPWKPAASPRWRWSRAI